MFLKTGDKVRVIAGKDKGKDGQIIKTIASANRVIVEGINKVKKHQKASQANPQGGVADVEAPINASNVMLIDPSNNEPTRISVEVKDGKKIRISKKSHKAID
ncbi:50S ribosomal protein L24 [Fructilactobacillus vespulae]|uniref:50S ribosomal protein L24 n=1 Tax=Fructilactobacillus vespulae TaxID=1249630 RepID=UPI0039B537EE